MTFKLNWGHVLPEGYEGPAWGARAIYSITVKGAVIDLLWDRQDAQGGTDEERRALGKWLNDRGLRQLREKCSALGISPHEHVHVRVEDGDYIIDANPRESCGYLYICAYRRILKEPG